MGFWRQIHSTVKMKRSCLSIIFSVECLAFNALHAVDSSLFAFLQCQQFAKECGVLCPFDGRKCKCSETECEKFKRNCSGKTFQKKRLGCVSRRGRRTRKCYNRKKPGEFCTSSNQCIDDGQAQYLCIANICQIPPECPPGHVSFGAECFPFAVTGGECVHPVQCLAGSVCIKGRCHGPCDEDQIYVDDECVHYEGAGCVARPCVKHKCPRAFPSCNYVPQKGEYLCCERQIRSAAQCPSPVSIPQLSQLTNEVVNCITEQCAPGFTCQFSNSGRGSYICCSVPDKKRRKNKETLKRNLFYYFK